MSLALLCVAATYYVSCTVVLFIYDAVESAVFRVAHARRVRRVYLGRLLLLAALAACSPVNAAPPSDQGFADQSHAWAPPKIEVHFSPNGGCTEAVVALILSARGSVRLAGYQFTSEPIARALISAHDRGRDVQALVDRSSERTRQVSELRVAGVPVYVDHRHHIFHDKFVEVDGETVETGSFNFTESAERSNAENCVTIRDAGVAKLFSANWLGHAAHAVGGGM